MRAGALGGELAVCRWGLVCFKAGETLESAMGVVRTLQGKVNSSRYSCRCSAPTRWSVPRSHVLKWLIARWTLDVPGAANLAFIDVGLPVQQGPIVKWQLAPPWPFGARPGSSRPSHAGSIHAGAATAGRKCQGLSSRSGTPPQTTAEAMYGSCARRCLRSARTDSDSPNIPTPCAKPWGTPSCPCTAGR